LKKGTRRKKETQQSTGNTKNVLFQRCFSRKKQKGSGVSHLQAVPAKNLVWKMWGGGRRTKEGNSNIEKGREPDREARKPGKEEKKRPKKRIMKPRTKKSSKGQESCQQKGPRAAIR